MTKQGRYRPEMTAADLRMAYTALAVVLSDMRRVRHDDAADAVRDAMELLRTAWTHIGIDEEL